MRAVDNVFLQSALHTVLPGVDALILQLERRHELYHAVDRHAIAQHTGDELGIVPVFGIELFGESLNGRLISALVLKLEVVAAGTVFVCLLQYLSLRNSLREHDSFVVVLQSGEYLIGVSVEQSYEGDPLLFVILESHHVALEHLRAHLSHFGVHYFGSDRGNGLLLLVFLLGRNHHSRAASVAVDGASLASRAPGFDIQLIDQLFVDVRRKVHRDADRMVDPLLYLALHLHLHEPVHVVGRSFLIW